MHKGHSMVGIFTPDDSMAIEWTGGSGNSILELTS